MPTLLSPRVVRCLLSGKAIRHKGCLAIQTPSINPQIQTKSQTRCFFGVNFFEKPPAPKSTPQLEPGVEKLNEFAKRLRLAARLIPSESISKALIALLRHKYKYGKQLLGDQHLDVAVHVYRYIRGQTGWEELWTTRDLFQFLSALRGPDMEPSQKPKASFDTRHGDLALLLYFDFMKRSPSKDLALNCEAVPLLISALCSSNQVEKAKRLITKGTVDVGDLAKVDQALFHDDETHVLLSQDGRRQSLPLILSAQFGDIKRMMEVVTIAHSKELFTSNLPRMMCECFAEMNMGEQAKEWYTRWRNAQRSQPQTSPPAIRAEREALVAIFEYCARNKDSNWARQIVSEIVKDHSKLGNHDLVLVWASYEGKGIDEINRMMDVLEESAFATELYKYQVKPKTIAALIKASIKSGDAYKAERFFQLAYQRNITPDPEMLALQIDYRIEAGDVEGALASYSALRNKASSDEYSASSSINKLIREMCKTKGMAFDKIMDVVGDLSMNNGQFDADTVAMLAVLHVTRAELDDAEDLLNTHAFQFSIAERQRIIEAVIDTCANPEMKAKQVWSIYRILRTVFDEMNRESRSQLMVELMKRGHGEQGLQVFEHMRMHSRADVIPDIDTYIKCFNSIGDLGDEDMFAKAHNLLKVDTSIDPTTRLYNTLIQTCVRCGLGRQALSFWDYIIASYEGPDINSIRFAFLACQYANGGANKALAIHRRLEASGFKMDGIYYSWVLAALGGQGHEEHALQVMEQLRKEKGVIPDYNM